SARARLHRHRYRGKTWYLLQDLGSPRAHRFTPAARFVLACMDGRRSVEELWQLARARFGGEAPTQDELIRWLGQLHAADLLQTEAAPDALEPFERGRQVQTQRARRSWANPMAIRIPLWDPARFLDRIDPWTRHLWSGWGLLGWLLVVAPALVLALAHASELTHNLADRVLKADNLLLLLLVFPAIKALHELGHATATRAGGGEVHELGVMLLVLVPVPYVDASSATVFRSKARRAIVGAAGMAVETFLAALALYGWLLVEPGPVRSTLFAVMLVAGVSTLIFNGNPLLRYDAYYILADLIEIPNLAQRSLRYWGYLLERALLRDHEAAPAAASRGERAWFLVYGLASTAYRIFIAFSIALFIGSRFFVIGVLLAAWALAMMCVLPVIRGVRRLAAQARTRRQRLTAGLVLGPVALALVAFVGFVPLPSYSRSEGLLWLPESAIVRAGGNGFFDAFAVEPGSRVSAGTVLARSHDPALDALIRLGEARLAELEAEYAAAFVSDRAQAEIVRQQLDAEHSALERARDRAAALLVRSGADGIFEPLRPQDMPGRYHRQGDVLGHVLGPGPLVARVVVRQGSVDGLADAANAVQLRFAHALDRIVLARVVREVPAGADRLPSKVLSQEGGGQVAVDPRDPQGLRTLERTFQVDIDLPRPAPQSTFYGERVFVRFEHRPQPLAEQAWVALRRLFLAHFDV
ncbi:MAG TPA: PqqD family protein, partial [Ideonella sp.]|nr:PqqD family protein [Ideonella sp.]